MRHLLPLILLLPLGTAEAQDAGPPMDEPQACDPACVVRYCESRCIGPHRDRLTGLTDCKRACVRVVIENACWPCKEDDK